MIRNVVVTGSDGMLGWHVRCRFSTLPEVQVVPCNRAQFQDDDYLRSAVRQAHVVVHLAGVNRGSETEIGSQNVALAERLVAACRATDSRPHVLFSSSTHADGESVYGVAKRRAAQTLADWAEQEDARFCNLVLPHVFGEHGRPFYNSVVHTFAHQLVQGQEPVIQASGQLSLLHAQEVAQLIWDQIEEGWVGTVRPKGTPISVAGLWERLQRLHRRYSQGVIPLLSDPLDLRLFNTLRSYYTHAQRAHTLQVHADHRGHLFEAIRADGQGQVFLSTTAPGITRGNHFHTRKVERFLVVEGEAEIKVRRMLTEDTFTYRVSGHSPQAIDIPILHTHNITNVGDQPLLTLFWTGEHFDPQDTDTFACPVEQAVAS